MSRRREASDARRHDLFDTRIRLTCPSGAHELAVLMFDGTTPTLYPETGRVRDKQGRGTDLWTDGAGHVLRVRRGCEVVAADETSTPQRITARCPVCNRQGERAAPRLRWERLVVMLDEATAAGATNLRVPLTT